MNEIIKINYDNNEQPTVTGRELHEALGVNSNYTTWFNRMCEYGFTENTDFVTCFPNLESENQHGGQNKTDHQLTIPMAKEICMIQRSEIGRQIRRYFISVEEQWNSPDAVISRALQMANRKLELIKSENVKLLTQIEENKPKVIFADAVSVSKSSILVGDLAKIIKQNGFDIGQKRLFAWLRENGYLIKRKGNDYNMPTQYSMELKLFEIKETVITHSDGHTTTNKTPKVTGKGQLYFINKFLS